MGFFRFIFGDPTERILEKLGGIVEDINHREPEYEK